MQHTQQLSMRFNYIEHLTSPRRPIKCFPLQTIGGLRQKKQPILYSNKKAAIFFQGYLTNLDELINDLLSGTELSSSFGSDCEPVQFSHGDQGYISAQTILQMYLRTGNDSDKLAMLLSELQAHFFNFFSSSPSFLPSFLLTLLLPSSLLPSSTLCWSIAPSVLSNWESYETCMQTP